MNVRLASCALVALNLAPHGAPLFADTKPDTPHLQFVTEYIKGLAALESIRVKAEGEATQDPQATFASVIHTSTLFQLELGFRIRRLKGMNLNAPNDQLISNITGFYERKITLWQRMMEIGSAFVAGPKPAIDYGAFAAEMPKLRAGLDYVDHALFEMTPLMFGLLIDPTPDSNGHTSHLIITKAERAKLIADLDTLFGSKIDQPDQNYTVSAAKLLKGYLLKDFKASDEPWE